jgi:hypothetical protein
MGTSLTIAIIVVLALLVSWLGGGRKWAFRTMLSLLILALLGGSGIVLYAYWTGKSAERRTQKLHECAVAKIATARCEPQPSSKAKPEHGPWEKYQNKADISKEVVWDICPPYELPDNPTLEQENAALVAAEQACKVEAGTAEKTLHEQVSEYRRQHGIKETTAAVAPQGDIFDQVVRECAAKVRKRYPGAYDDLDDATLVKKVLAKYPKYCEPNSGDPPGWEPVIEGIR